MYYLTKSGWITSDKELEKKPYLHKIGNNIGQYSIDDSWFETLDYVIKQSESVFALIEVGDLVKYVYYDNSVGVNMVDESDLKRLTAINSLYDNLRKSVKAIYKPDLKGNYIKVWEKESE